jgi:O-antigen/teichoic acid export membrane protein
MGFGVNPAVKKRLSEGRSDAHVSAGLLMQFGLFVLLATGILIFDSYLNQYVGAPVAIYIVAILFAKNLVTATAAVFEGKKLVHLSGALRPLDAIARNALQIGAILVGFGLTGMFLGYAVGSLIAGLIGLWFLSIHWERPTVEEVKSLVEYAKFAWIDGIRSRGFSWVDIAVLGFFVTSNLVAIYQVAWTIGAFFTLFGSSVTRAVFPEISELSSDESYEAVGNLVTTSLAFSGLFLLPGLGGVLVLGDLVLSLYGSEFVRGTQVLPILIVAQLLYVYQRQLTNSLGAIDRPDLSFRVNGLFIVSNVVLNVVLVTYSGWIGAAVATVLATGIGLSVAYRLLSNILSIEVIESLMEVLRQILATAVMVVLVFGLRQIIGESLVAMTAMIVAGGCIYFGVLTLLSPRFRGVVGRNLSRQIL